MYTILIFFVIGLFAAMLFLNVYFRVRVFKAYRKLVEARIDFSPAHIFSTKKMETEILPKYPEHAADIKIFSSHLRYSIRMASVLIFLITLFGAVLMYYR